MTLIDDYLRAVALLLPKDKRPDESNDIIEELRELILSRIEARESELGRTLTDDETEQVLRDLGHPLVVASRYRDGPQHLVGPAIYPYWLFAVKAAVTIEIALAALVFLVRLLTGDVARAGHAISAGFTGALILIGLATVAAWMIDRRFIRIHTFDNWRVKDLRFLGFAAWDADSWRDWWAAHQAAPPPDPRSPKSRPDAQAWRSPDRPGPSQGAEPMSSAAADPYYWGKRGRRRYRRDYGAPMRRWGGSPAAQGLGGVAAGVVLLLWWVGLLHFGVAGSVEDFRTLGIEPGPLASLDWAGLKAQLYLPVLAYVGLVVAQGALRIAHPDAVRMNGLLDIAVAVLVLGTVGWLWTLSPLASAVQVETVAAFARRMRDLFQDGPPFPLGPALTLVLAIAAFGGVIRGLRGLFELVLPSPHPWSAPAGRPA